MARLKSENLSCTSCLRKDSLHIKGSLRVRKSCLNQPDKRKYENEKNGVEVVETKGKGDKKETVQMTTEEKREAAER